MIKTYVIDTNVLIQAPYALECFEDNHLVLPLVVLEELDGLKKAEGEKGANARAAVRKLEEYRHKGDLLQGVELPGGGCLRVEKNYVNVELPPDLPDDKPDNRILKVCKGLADDKKADQVILVTKDIVLRLKAQILGIKDITDVRVLIRYDIENLSDDTYNKALTTVFSEPPVDDVYESTDFRNKGRRF